ncbi:anti-phage ZorAB system protein ZorA [Acidovorax sp. Leaf160]|uniref:anti-phage ZorAB system protein ZorA n=1 Tax=Acidovorax sp. Leaf160 TaxID=1736280 RepID=UPI0006FA6FEE|nr:anti-phage ZorAB system protein ZorA [Acidovorax sp. Leaf160]KQR49970.1 tellurium resistance protein TerC [Acidovorax sp. Leaf160]
MNLQSILATAPTPVLATGAVLAFLILVFLTVFLVPGVLHWNRLRAIQKDIQRFDSKNSASEFKKVFARDRRLAHLWKEYQDSLHIQREERDGQLTVIATRATAPAELYFNSQFVVDSRLRTEFFKHLPGLFTGIGIIGTFSGLIEGLRQFQVSENAATVRDSLQSLMHLVGEAFLVSAAAIAAAMLVTFIEKLLLASLYRRTEEIAHDIDASFDSGAGEEYLSRLVRASEDSASQSKILKDALVKELGELLRELTSAQITASKDAQLQLVDRLTQTSKEQVDASREDNKALGATIAESIQQSLQGPLQDIASTVKAASGDQSATAARMLQDVMASFSQRLNDLFGGQISGLSDLNQQTAKSIQDAVGTLQTLVANIEESSRRSTDTMAERMAQAIEKMEARQEAMNAQSAAFIEQIRQLVASSQSETNTKLQATLETIGTQVAGMLATLNDSQAAVFESNRAREQVMADRTTSAVNSMSESVEAAIKEIGVASTQMAQNVAVLTQTTSTSVDKMNAGAEQLGAASRNFAAAGERVTGVLGQAASVTAKLAETSGALTAGASTLQDLLRDYRVQRDAVGQLVAELRETVELARKEASLTTDILARIESSATRLGTAQKQADEYLEGVSRVLGEAHTTFATEVRRTLEKANTEFHNKLGAAVGLLSSGVQELEVTLASMGNMKPARV